MSLFLCFCRRRRSRNSIDKKTTRLDSSNRVNHVNGVRSPPKSPPTSSDIVYFPSVVNSHRVINHHVAPNTAVVDAILLTSESPVLRPLSPLGRRDFRHMYANAVGFDWVEEEDEVYSPRWSSPSHDSLIGTRSPSRRGPVPAAAEIYDASGESNSSSSCSLSNSCSSTQSVSFDSSRSSPISSRPRNLSIESPELVTVQTATFLPAQPPLHPQPPIMIQLADLSSSPSPSSPSSSSPDRDSTKSLDSSPRTSNFSNSNAESPVKTYTVFWSRLNSSKIHPSGLLLSDTHAENGDSPALIINFGSNHPNRWNSQSTSVSSIFSSPERPLGKNRESQPFVSNPLHHSTESHERLESTIQKPVPVSVIHPKPLPRPPGGREKMNSTSSIRQQTLEPPVLITPSKASNGRPVLPSTKQVNRVLDPKKAQNIAFSLRALNINIDVVREALSEGNVDTLGTELLHSLLNMAPTKEEEHRLKEHKDISLFKFGPAERFLRAVLDIPFAFKRVDAMLYISNFESEIEDLKKSLNTIEAACEELKNSKMFLKLLEAVLKTGNQMNSKTSRSNACAFKLDMLLNFVDVKGPDGKTTLLHFVVQEIIRTEGSCFSGGNQDPNTTLDDDAKCRKLGLQVVSGLCSELKSVKNAATMDSKVFVGGITKLSKGIEKIKEMVQLTEEMGLKESIRKFSVSMKRFKRTADQEIIRIRAQENASLSLVKEITEYFQGNSAKEAAHPFRIFMVVSEFLTILDRVCKEVGMINDLTAISSTSTRFR